MADTNRPVSVVIGAGSGIGRAIAHALAPDTQVVVADRETAAAASVADEVGGTSVVVDVTDEAGVEELFATAAALGPLGGVVNSAGVSTLSSVVDHDVDDFRRVVDTCLTGSLIVLKHGGRALAEGGSMVTIASLNARQPGTGMAAYCSAKAGVAMLTEVAALELAQRNIRVNAVSPGLVVTPLTQPAMDIPGIRESYLENTPLGRSGEPEEVAALVRFLLSDDARWITGENIDINGGAHLARYPDLLGLVTRAFS